MGLYRSIIRCCVHICVLLGDMVLRGAHGVRQQHDRVWRSSSRDTRRGDRFVPPGDDVRLWCRFHQPCQRTRPGLIVAPQDDDCSSLMTFGPQVATGAATCFTGARTSTCHPSPSGAGCEQQREGRVGINYAYICISH
jgi:hypothetical protein